MANGVILYQSKYGATKKYADWLREATGFDCVETKKARGKDIESYGTVILCGGVYASGIAGLSFLKKNMAQLREKKLAVFCVGASPYEEKAFLELQARNMRDELSGVPLFYGRGAWDEEKMSLKDRTLCRMLQKAVAKQDPDTCEPWMKALMSAAGQACDWTDKAYLTPLLDDIGKGHGA